eukprot:752115-Hanusia_phi.AAC.5
MERAQARHGGIGRGRGGSGTSYGNRGGGPRTVLLYLYTPSFPFDYMGPVKFRMDVTGWGCGGRVKKRGWVPDLNEPAIKVSNEGGCLFNKVGEGCLGLSWMLYYEVIGSGTGGWGEVGVEGTKRFAGTWGEACSLLKVIVEEKAGPIAGLSIRVKHTVGTLTLARAGPAGQAPGPARRPAAETGKASGVGLSGLLKDSARPGPAATQ